MTPKRSRRYRGRRWQAVGIPDALPVRDLLEPTAAAALGIPPPAWEALRTIAVLPSIRRLELGSDLQAAAAVVPTGEATERLFRLRSALPPGLQAMLALLTPLDYVQLSTRSWPKAAAVAKRSAVLALFAANEPDGLLWARGTGEADAGVGPGDILEEWRRWQRSDPIELVGAGADWVLFDLGPRQRSPPGATRVLRRSRPLPGSGLRGVLTHPLRWLTGRYPRALFLPARAFRH